MGFFKRIRKHDEVNSFEALIIKKNALGGEIYG